ncbi:MAG: class I SAM-dependent methyltransferase family protein [Methanothrix sp.]|nr:class I SAM-dependent methyltransferase family protein [Methanothrix sp.]
MRLKEKLQGVVPEECLAELSDGFHVIGDIAILSLAPELMAYKKEIAEAVLSSGKSIHTVLNKTTKLQGERRLAGFDLLAGCGNTVTTHKEFGFLYRLDVAKVFFNSHLGYERMRVAAKVVAGEDVLLPFSGVGPFAVPLAAYGAHVLALEKSREACLYLAENARLNRVERMIAIVNADAFQMAKLLRKDFHRAVIPAPYGADGILEIVLPLVKSRGSLHLYTFKKLHQIEPLKKSYQDLGLEVMQARRCGNIAPGVCRWVFDLAKS